MYQVEDDTIETLHLYVVREADKRPSRLPVIVSLVTLSILIAIGILTPYQQPVTRTSIRVPAVPLAVKTFTASTPVVPTGIKTYPATTAHGILTITNGSVIAQIIPAGFTVQSVVTDRGVYVPAGSANGFGYATVPAHALVSGQRGNFASLAINQVIGSSVYVRNLSAFQGGRDAYTVEVATAQDRQTALLHARRILLSRISGLHYPCSETLSGAVIVTWRCQVVSYHLPLSLHVSAVHFAGKDLILAVWYVAYPRHIWMK